MLAQAWLLAALLRLVFDQLLVEKDEAEELCPLGDDVADDLSPLAFRIHLGVEDDPGCARDGEKDGEGVVLDDLGDAVAEVALRLIACSRADLIEIFRCEDGRYDARPVSDGVAEEGAPVRVRIAVAIEQD